MADRRTIRPSIWKQPLRQDDQAFVAMLLWLCLFAMVAYWWYQRGPSSGLVDIDRATPLEAEYRVDMNTAQSAELSVLPGIGETLAGRIIDSRKTEGAFRTVDELQRVKGVGPKLVDRMRPYIIIQ